MVVKNNKQQQLQSLLDLNSYFDEVVNRIPAGLYISNKIKTEEQEAKILATKNGTSKKYHKGQNAESKQAKKAKAKTARYKDIDESMKTTVEVLQEQNQDEADTHTNSLSSPQSLAGAAAGQSKIEALRAKLHAKIEAKRRAAGVGEGDGKNINSNSAAQQISKRAARKQRKLELQQRKKDKSGFSAAQKQARKSGGSSSSDQNDVITNTPLSESVSKTLDTIDYGGITGLETNIDYTKDNKSLSNVNKKKNLQHLLKVAEEKNARLRDLKEKAKQGDAEAQEKVAKIQWSDAMKQADGQKEHLKDPSLIKKNIKRKATQKKRSAAKWSARMDQVEENVKSRQKIREHNLKQRKLGGVAGSSLSKKRMINEKGETVDDKGEVVGGKQKKPRLGPHSNKTKRAGFEGKKSEYLNKKE